MSTTLRVWRRNWLAFAVITGVIYLPFVALAVFLAQVDAAQPLAIVAGPLFNLLTLVSSGGVTYGVFQELNGKRPGLGACIGVGLRRTLPVLGIALLVTMAIWVGSLALVIPGLIALSMFYAAVPAGVVERRGLGTALERSMALTQGHRLLILATTLRFSMVLMLGVVVVLLGAVELRFVRGPLTGIATATTLALGVSSLQAVLATVVYHELRVRKDGVSADELARVFD